MENDQLAQLDNNTLLGYLKAQKAPILDMDTDQLDILFAQTLNAYSTLRREFEDAPFVDDLYTGQKKFPSFAYKHVVKKAETPKGSGKAPDVLHMAFRKLGMRVANTIIAAAKELIGNEAIIRTPEKDRPPSEEARKVLDDTQEFIAHLVDQNRQSFAIPVQNKRTQVFKDGEMYSVLETALAIREQSIAVNGSNRSRESFEWIRDVFALQSLHTIIQTQNILREAIEEHLPGKTLKDFRLVVSESERIQFARAVLERSHETKRDHALMTTLYPQDASMYKNNLNSSEYALNSVGQTSNGFTIQQTPDLATLLYAMPESLSHLRFIFTDLDASQIELPKETSDAIKKLSTDIWDMEFSQAKEEVRQQIDLLGLAVEKLESCEATTQKVPPNYVPEYGVRQATALIKEAVL